MSQSISKAKMTEVENYLKAFFATRQVNYNDFYRDEFTHRRVGIYQRKEGPRLMDFLHSIMAYIESQLTPPLVPDQHTSPHAFVISLKWFGEYLDELQALLDLNADDKELWDISHLQGMKNELKGMVEHVLETIDLDNDHLPYHQLKACLVNEDVDGFIKGIKSLLKGIPYNIDHTGEGYLHSNIHLLLSLLGFDIISEETTNTGRIDAVIRFSKLIYIIEFKLNSCDEAMDQIKRKEYHEKYVIHGKRVIGVGVSFTKENRNIGEHKSELLVP